MLIVINFYNNNYEFFEISIYHFFFDEFFFNVRFKFSSKHIYFKIIISIRFIQVFLETLNVIDY